VVNQLKISHGSFGGLSRDYPWRGISIAVERDITAG
jgi:hypothetical protein